MKKLIIIFAIFLSSCSHVNTYRTLVIFDDNKPMGEMAVQYYQTFITDHVYNVGDTLRGLYKDQVVINKLK